MLKIKKALVTVAAEYSDFAGVFLEKPATVLPEYTEINTHAINLKKGKLQPYQPIYNPSLIELETLETYIETNLTNSFICFFKSSADV